MYTMYDDLPLNILILKDSTLEIQYFNKKFKNTFKTNYNIVGENISIIDCFDTLYNNLETCFHNKISQNIGKVNIINKYFDITIKPQSDSLVIFLYEISNYVQNEIKAKQYREKLLSISTEMKTKYDIVQNIRKIEKESLVHLKNIMNNISEGIIVLDKHGIFDFCNKAALEIMNYTMDDMKNYDKILEYIDIVNYRDYATTLKEAYDYCYKNFRDLENLVIKIPDKVLNGYKYIDVNLNRVINSRNEIVYTVITLKDITEMKLNEIMIIKQNKELEKITRMKDEFFNMISHELRTPLTIIHSSLQLANYIYSKEITPNIDKILLRINQNCTRLLKLINNTLDISKAEAGFLKLNYSIFDIVFVTENIVSSVNYYAKSKNLQLIFDTNEEEIDVRLDKDKYEKIILNLLSNAIKFTPKEKEILIIIDTNHKEVSIKVKDTGIGIPKDKISTIFDRFQQIDNSLSRNSEGTGLGLALVKEFVEIMKGKIYVDSTIGQGTEFSIVFDKEILQKNEEENSFNIEENLSDKIIIEFSDV